MQMISRKAAGSQAAFGARSARPARAVVARAEKTSLAVPGTSRPGYLDGTLPGDYGFDPLGLMDPQNSGGFMEPNWLRYGEIMNARWAMLGAAGCIAPEVLGKSGLIPEATNIVWFQSGVIPPAGSKFEYWTDNFSLFYVEVLAMQFAELKRWQDYRYPGSQGKQYFLGLERVFQGSGDPAYPGGPFFNLFNLGGKSEAEMKSLKQKEIKNGRLAMLAMFGYGAQAVMTREGPYQNLLDHLADPVGNNIITNFATAFSS